MQDGWTALHEAIANGHKDCVKILLDYGGDLELPTEEGKVAHQLFRSANFRLFYSGSRFLHSTDPRCQGRPR